MLTRAEHRDRDETNCGAEHDGGTLTISDVDSAATFVAQSNVAGGSYGTFTIDAGGRLDLHGEHGPRRVRRPARPTPTASRLPAADGTTHVGDGQHHGTNDAAVLSARHGEPDRDQRAR